jgi:hypothetical protein
MEANRPTPTDLHKFEVGQSRDSVRQRLGPPDDSVVQTDGTNCDRYLLYTKGYGTGGKAGVALLEGAADVLTLGLTEIVLTPTEALTKSRSHIGGSELPACVCLGLGEGTRLAGGPKEVSRSFA